MKSRYNASRNITIAQYVAEVMCERRAKHMRQYLPDKFWKLPEWKPFFLYQLMIANALMKKYGRLITLAAIIKKVDTYIWSLKHSSVIPAIEETQKERMWQKKNNVPYLHIVNKAGIGKHYDSFTIVDLLDELDT